jgi:3',5'-cyclic AMP phosphodiesterase CpdA
MSSNRVYTASGNHDYMIQATYGDVFYSQNMFAENAVFGSDNKNYYYVDNPQQKIRYIILSTYGTENGNVIEIMGDTHFDEAQFTWFTSNALNAPSDYSIIVFTHHFYGINTDESVSLDLGEKRYVDAINSHNSVSDEKVIAVFCGHVHRDRIINLSSEQAVYQSTVRDNSTVPCITTTCDKNVPYAGIINDMNIKDRTAGTVREQAFDVMVIDKTNKNIKCIRIGCEALDGIGGSPDRTAEQNSGEPVEIREVTYPV